MTEVAKEYILVPLNEYNRMKTNKTINPFQNPDVKRAKLERREMERVASDKSITPERANMEINQMLKSYRTSVSRVLGKRPPQRAKQQSPETDGKMSKRNLDEIVKALRATEREMDNERKETPAKKRRREEDDSTGRMTEVSSVNPSANEVARAKDFMGGHLRNDHATCRGAAENDGGQRGDTRIVGNQPLS